MSQVGSEWREADRAQAWFARRKALPRRSEAEAVLLEDVLRDPVSRVLDLGAGDGYLIAVVRERWPRAQGVGLDHSTEMLDAARGRLPDVEFREHDLMEPLPDDLGDYDAVVSSLALHHIPHARKRELYREVHALLRPGGRFANLDVVDSGDADLHDYANQAFGFVKGEDEKSDVPAPLPNEVEWLQAAGFRRVDCYWKWLELALVAGEC